MDLAIGDAARLTGLPVRTIRYYSDIGLVPPAARSAGGYRRYDQVGIAQLELIRSLRQLGLDLGSIRRVVAGENRLEEVTRAQAAAVDTQIRQLMLRRAVLGVINRGGHRPEEVQRMTDFAQASAEEAGRLVEEFVASAFAGHETTTVAEKWRAGLPVLPEQPSAEQIDAWIELAGLVRDQDFASRIRAMVVEGARQRAATGIGEADPATQSAAQDVVARGGAALGAGLLPTSPEAAALVDQLVAVFAEQAGREDGPAYRVELAAQLARFSDARVERYWQLVSVINGWPQPPTQIPAYEWFMAALRADGAGHSFPR